MKVEERLFSVEEVAERLGMSKWTITDWLKAGRLKGSKIGKFWRVQERDLQAFIDHPPPLQRASAAPPADVSPLARKATLLARIRALQAEGRSQQEIANQLNREGVPTISGKGQWQKGTIANLLAQGSPVA